MSVLIKGMEMPNNCGECQFCHTENFTQWCCPTGRKDVFYDAIPEWCPLEEPKTEMALCALADRTCPFQGEELAWCLTCPHISEEDRALVKKAVSEPKTGECETCKRNADNGGFYDDGRTRCPIQEHYALLKDGYCHLYEPKMRGEEE